MFRNMTNNDDNEIIYEVIVFKFATLRRSRVDTSILEKSNKYQIVIKDLNFKRISFEKFIYRRRF